MSLRYLTAGESHGKGLVVIVEGLPAGLPLCLEDVSRELARRQAGYGRGGRMKIETDQGEFLSGVRRGMTLGSPIAFWIPNRDYENWEKIMSPSPHADAGNPLRRPRPGHADLPGGIKYNHRDLRNVLERASARETAARVAAGAMAKRFLREFGVTVQSHVVQLGAVKIKTTEVSLEQLNERADASPVRMVEKEAEEEAVRLIDEAARRGDTLGGIFEILAGGLPPGLGSHVHWDRKLDGRLAQALLSIQAVKGVEIGPAFDNAGKFGSEVHDEIAYDSARGFYHLTNRAGGLEGGITNGETLRIRVAKKPISTLKKPLSSVDIETKQPTRAGYERSDVCALPAASVIGENVTALVLADAFLEKFGGDFLEEIRRHWMEYRRHIQAF